MSHLAVVHCAQLVTLAPSAEIIPDGAMLVRDGRVQATGPRSAIEPLISAETEVIDAGGRIVLPGFIDAHTHPVFAGNRADEFVERIHGATYSGIAARGGGIRGTVRLTRAAPEDDLLAIARRYCEWFLRGGTTTIEAKSGYGLSLEAEMKILRVLRRLGEDGSLRVVPTFLGAHEIPDEYRGCPEDYVQSVIHEMLPAVAREKLAEFCDVFCEPDIFSIGQARAVLQTARHLGLGLRIHADQFTPDYASRLAAELHTATADHLEAASAASLDALKAAGVAPVLLPASVYHLGSARYPDARAMIDLGLPVVLATDFNPGSSPTASIPMVLSLACTQLKMTPAEAIAAVTVNAAASLRRAHEIGSLEPGKLADFVIHDADDYRELPYFFGRDPARAVYVNGRLQFSS